MPSRRTGTHIGRERSPRSSNRDLGSRAGVPVAGALAPQPKMPRLIVPCPDCRAEVNEPCRTAEGRETSAHASRKRMSARWRREHPEPVQDLNAQPTCQVCGAQVRLRNDGTAQAHVVGGGANAASKRGIPCRGAGMTPKE